MNFLSSLHVTKQYAFLLVGFNCLKMQRLFLDLRPLENRWWVGFWHLDCSLPTPTTSAPGKGSVSSPCWIKKKKKSPVFFLHLFLSPMSHCTGHRAPSAPALLGQPQLNQQRLGRQGLETSPRPHRTPAFFQLHVLLFFIAFHKFVSVANLQHALPV